MKRLSILAMLTTLILSSCASLLYLESPFRHLGSEEGASEAGSRGRRAGGATGAAESAGGTTSVGSGASLSERQRQIVDAAYDMVGRTSLLVGGTRFNWDCSGTILAIYASAGIYLGDLFPRYSGNGVSRLHQIGESHGLLHDSVLPAPGDIVFFDNTYDRNGDRAWNDYLTHAGVVVSVDDSGAIEYVHHNYREGIVVARMNLMLEDAYPENSPMRMKSHRHLNPDEWLSSHLYREFAALYALPAEL
jgi:hypothetical protein